jgi:hypothetical protein
MENQTRKLELNQETLRRITEGSIALLDVPTASGNVRCTMYPTTSPGAGC